MKKNLLYLFLIVAVWIPAIIMFTCQTKEQKVTQAEPDKSLLSYLETEKQVNETKIGYFQRQLNVLNRQNDSLKAEVQKSDRQLNVSFEKAKDLEARLMQKLQDTALVLLPDSLFPIADSLSIAVAQEHSSCEEAIADLQRELVNRDSTISVQRQMAGALRDLQKEQAIQNEELTRQLDTAFKTLRKKNRQNKIIVGGTLILSGISNSLLLIHSMK